MTGPRFSPRPTRDDQRDDHHDHLDDQVMSRDAPIFIDGPWSHRSVSANGTRFHVAESGDGPLVLLLHGFPEFWWTWREQLSSLKGAGFRAVAVDLRGFGGSDKPPRGYDLVTAASDAAGGVPARGAANAVVGGPGCGGAVRPSHAPPFPPGLRPRAGGDAWGHGPCTCRARWTAASCPARPVARAGTSGRLTGGASLRAPGTSRRRRCPSASIRSCAPGWPTPSPSDDKPSHNGPR